MWYAFPCTLRLCHVPSNLHVTFWQEYAKFNKFTDSLLTRAGKLSDLIASLETALEESGKPKDGSEGERVKRPLDSVEYVEPLCMHIGIIYL